MSADAVGRRVDRDPAFALEREGHDHGRRLPIQGVIAGAAPLGHAGGASARRFKPRIRPDSM